MYMHVYILNAYMCVTERKAEQSSFISHGLFSQSKWESTGALTSSTKVTQVIWSPGAAVDRQAGRWPRVC